VSHEFVFLSTSAGGFQHQTPPHKRTAESLTTTTVGTLYDESHENKLAVVVIVVVVNSRPIVLARVGYVM